MVGDVSHRGPVHVEESGATRHSSGLGVQHGIHEPWLRLVIGPQFLYGAHTWPVYEQSSLINTRPDNAHTWPLNEQSSLTKTTPDKAHTRPPNDLSSLFKTRPDHAHSWPMYEQISLMKIRSDNANSK